VQGLLPTCLLEQFDLWQNEDDSLSGIPKYANKARQRQRLSILSRSLPEESAAAIESLNAAAGTQQVGMSVLRVRLHKVV
jgi:diketogulonate reductase-like aldo/keto reductase